MGKALKGKKAVSIEERAISAITALCVDAVERAKSGHPGMPMGDASMAYVLWTKAMRYNPGNPLWPNRDRFILSAGHGSMLLYSLLHLTGYGISLEDIKNFRQWGSKTPGHPEYNPGLGIETTTGPLGQGFATGVGMAMAEKYLRGLFNRPGFPVLNYNIYGILSDGDMMEGISSEAASLAGHLKLGKLIYLYSDNKITIEGSTSLTFTEDVRRRFLSYGWHVLKTDGYDLKAVEQALRAAKDENERPSLIMARTHIGHECPGKQDTPEVHGAPIGPEAIRLFKECLCLPQKDFYIPKEVLAHMRKAASKGVSEERKWKALFERWRKKEPELARLWDRLSGGKLHEGVDRALPRFKPSDGPIATRSASGKALNSIAGILPELIGGSADLAPSNNTHLKGFPDFSAKQAGRNIHFGVREHAMAAALNGMALSGMLIPYGGTFLVFADYMMASARLAALMKARVLYILTHDSIGVGEDGPTHQPVEHLTHLRAIPGMTVIRPADANETVLAWKVALGTKGPSALILSRQNLPVIDRSHYASAGGLKRGAYIVSDSKGAPELILIGSGSEVHLCLSAADELRTKGVNARVVNMASMELFEAQDWAYKESVLPPGVKKRLAVEAGATLSWHKYVGLEGAVIGMDRFGASAPGKTLFAKFGFTVENIIQKAAALLRGR